MFRPDLVEEKAESHGVRQFVPHVAAEQILHGQLAADPLRVGNRTGFFTAVVVEHHRIVLLRFAISIAATAASTPLLPALVPLRSIACSRFSAVIMP